jgi:hypothetical protein
LTCFFHFARLEPKSPGLGAAEKRRLSEVTGESNTSVLFPETQRSLRWDTEEQLFTDSLSESDRQYYRAQYGLGNSQVEFTELHVECRRAARAARGAGHGSGGLFELFFFGVSVIRSSFCTTFVVLVSCSLSFKFISFVFFALCSDSLVFSFFCSSI